jgi:beta-phosphoglucomutase-like phosphatase (HAD superfamily)
MKNRKTAARKTVKKKKAPIQASAPVQQVRLVEPPQLPPPKKALLFELEYFIGPCRRFYSEAIKAALAERDIRLSPSLFVKQCLYPPVKSFTPALLDLGKKKHLSSDKIAQNIVDEVIARLMKNCHKDSAAIRELVTAALAKGHPVAAISCFSQPVVNQLTAELQWPPSSIKIMSLSESGKDLPGLESWLRLAHDISTPPSRCLVLTASARACRAALAAHMRCVAVPDEFTGFQDYSGSDFVFDKLDRSSLQNILTLLEAS